MTVPAKSLIDKIDALPPDKKAEVEDFVEFLARRDSRGADSTRSTFPEELLAQINAGRESLLAEQGLIETQEILRTLREEGGR